jgi:class 3 adenylate cyclase
MKCPKCTFESPAGQRFCGKCGTRLEKICPKCGIGNPAEYDFCGDCGHDLRRPAETHALDYSQPQTYTPKHLAEKILTARNSIEGERKLVTVLFTDVADYTSISERLDPEEVHRIMDGCFRILVEEIHRHEGTVDKFTGDGVMALFGAPLAHEDHAQRACHAALSIQKAIAEYGEKVRKDCGVEFRMRVGLNSGPVIVGTIGDDLRMDYTAIGDTTNLASRMETMAAAGTVRVSENTHRLARDYFEFASLGEVAVKGKERLQPAYELLRAGKAESRIAASVARGLTRFVGRRKQMEALEGAFEQARTGAG